MGVTVRAMVPADVAAWDHFVRRTQAGSFFHLAGWSEVFSAGLGLTPRYLLAERDGEIAGVLPLVHQKSRLFGNALIAAPFLVEGGPLAADSEAREALDRRAMDMLGETGAAYLEFRSRKASRAGWQAKKDLYATFKRDIGATEQENLQAIPRKQRAVVRKTLAGPLVSTVDGAVDRFYRVYSESVRNLGTPVFSKRYFSTLTRIFGDQCDLVVILDNGQPVSAVMNFYFGDTVLPYYGGGTAAARRTGANDFLYWEVIRRAAARGLKKFDFGRSKAGSGAFHFKKNWGFEPEWLEYEFWLPGGEALPEKNPNNPRYKLAIEAWKRLPLPIANFLGPFLISSLG